MVCLGGADKKEGELDQGGCEEQAIESDRDKV